MVLSSNTPSTKYESIMSELSEYMRHRQLPIALQHRLVEYYAHRFRKTYFRESAILPILSDRLQSEIKLHCYTALVESVSILQDLPENLVNLIVSHLKSEIYLPNDIIIKAGTDGDCMYFIASGTVAVSTPTGREVCHLQDGAYFGEVALIKKDHKRIANVVAIEICKVYKLESKIFKMCLAEQPDTFKKLEKICQDRFNRTNFLEELHKKHILEKSLARKHDTD
ncbi:i[[h]] channel isoform e [Holotrichia oblita]|uniref:I[[h]] channel isoform e n=3 Tax=Holotrichia oblita TaxID=644536 RepID=A0ACB9TKH8_HOLOL|nr:i[[h]] channel isoform e [Holotrichia oblita]KAI4467268.1 i[[h]] channel isoform e [Holotrichia oblita]KAI4467277.1 i[[h]] channel isoform e [Holotrichia oblita]